MMMDFSLGYDLGMWYDYGEKEKVIADISSNSHFLICGMSGSGKSYVTSQFFSRLVKANPTGEFHFADYKRDDSFSHLRGQPRYYAYKNVAAALDIVFNRLQARMSGEDKTRHAVFLVFDEYVAYILQLSRNKKVAEIEMGKAGDILLQGRSMNINMVVSCQRADAKVFDSGAVRQQFGVIMVLGTYQEDTYRMLMKGHVDKIENRIKRLRKGDFKRGEGSVLTDMGSTLNFIKIPMVANIDEMQAVCRSALG